MAGAHLSSPGCFESTQRVPLVTDCFVKKNVHTVQNTGDTEAGMAIKPPVLSHPVPPTPHSLNMYL